MKSSIESWCGEYPSLDLAVWPIFHRMSVEGITVDRDKMMELAGEVEEFKEAARAQIQVLTGKDVNPSSGD